MYTIALQKMCEYQNIPFRKSRNPVCTRQMVSFIIRSVSPLTRMHFSYMLAISDKILYHTCQRAGKEPPHATRRRSGPRRFRRCGWVRETAFLTLDPSVSCSIPFARSGARPFCDWPGLEG